MRGRTHAQPLGDPPQRYRRPSPQTRGDSELLRVTLTTALQVLRAPTLSAQLLLRDRLCECPGTRHP